MTGNKQSDCKDQLKNIARDHKPYLDAGWEPKTLNAKATLYRFVPESAYNPKSKRIDRFAFEDAGFSVIASGGEFEVLDDKDVKEKVLKRNQEGRHKFVGAVKIDSTVFTSEEYGKFNILHDPHPFKKGGEPQDPNHVSIICVKNDDLVDLLVEAPDWAVKPEDLAGD